MSVVHELSAVDREWLADLEALIDQVGEGMLAHADPHTRPVTRGEPLQDSVDTVRELLAEIDEVDALVDREQIVTAIRAAARSADAPDRSALGDVIQVAEVLCRLGTSRANILRALNRKGIALLRVDRHSDARAVFRTVIDKVDRADPEQHIVHFSARINEAATIYDEAWMKVHVWRTAELDEMRGVIRLALDQIEQVHADLQKVPDTFCEVAVRELEIQSHFNLLEFALALADDTGDDRAHRAIRDLRDLDALDELARWIQTHDILRNAFYERGFDSAYPELA